MTVIRRIKETNIRKIYIDGECIGVIATKYELLDNDLLLPEFSRDNPDNWVVIVNKKIIKETKSFEECKTFVINNSKTLIDMTRSTKE